MNPGQEEKKLADIRKELTPGNDEEGDSFDEVYSEPDSEEDKSIFKDKSMVKEFQDQERWEDTPDRQHGQTMTLQPVEETEKVQQDWNQEKQKEQKTEHQEEKKEIRETDSPSRRMRYEERPQLKSKTIPYDSRFIYAAYYLIRDQLLALMGPGEGFIKFNPYVNSKTIRVYAYDEKKCQEVADKVDEYINEIQLSEMGKYEAESGVQLSYKYLESLSKQNITFFKDKTQNYKTLGYYICGKVASKKILHQKLSEIRNTNFAWIHLFRFQDTRSYRAILRKIFETPQMHQFAMEKFKAREIEVASLKRDFLLPAKDKKGVLILLTYHGQRKMSIYQEIEQLLSSFIRQTFAVFCLIFKRKKSSFSNKYTPKVDKVTMFFISERPHISATCYLYIIVKKSDFKEVRETIVKEVEAIGLDIRGRRFFRNIYPDKEDFGDESNYKVFCYPKFHPYSWSIEARKDQEFDWISGFKI